MFEKELNLENYCLIFLTIKNYGLNNNIHIKQTKFLFFKAFKVLKRIKKVLFEYDTF